MKVLIVDDNDDAAQILSDASDMVGCDLVDTVNCGEDAIGKAIIEEYDIITLDVRMPGVSGLDALSVIRGLRPHAVLAIISAYTRDIDPDSMSAADVVLSKPVSLQTFQSILKFTKEISECRKSIRDLGDS